jgi:hypothetical protein
MLSPMPTYLLDKNVVRRIVEGLTHPDRLTDEEVTAIALWRVLRESKSRMFISAETANIMGRFSTWRGIRLFLDPRCRSA